MRDKNQIDILDYLTNKIKSNLSPDLLKPEYKMFNKYNPTFGHCYVASEALFHLAGGKASGLSIKRARDASNISHWWLESEEGQIFDPTSEQYEHFGTKPPYDSGVSTGFLTKTPSKRAQVLMDRCLT